MCVCVCVCVCVCQCVCVCVWAYHNIATLRHKRAFFLSQSKHNSWSTHFSYFIMHPKFVVGGGGGIINSWNYCKYLWTNQFWMSMPLFFPFSLCLFFEAVTSVSLLWQKMASVSFCLILSALSFDPFGHPSRLQSTIRHIQTLTSPSDSQCCA